MVGRGVTLRHALADAGVPFEDVRIPLSEWPAHKDDPSFGGPYGALPTLTWGAATVAETLPIASFLGRRLGRRDGLDAAAVARLEAVCSVAWTDVSVRFAEILWCDFLFPGADQARALPIRLGWMLDKLGRLDAQLAGDTFFGGPSPDLADFFVAEAVETTLYVIGSAREPLLRERLPRLVALADRVRARPAVAHACVSRPPTFTAHPDEPAIVERLRAVDLSALGL